MNTLSCLNSLSNTGLSNCSEVLGMDMMLLWLKDDFEIATEASALLQATWEDGKNAKNVYPFPLFLSVEPQDEDDVYETLPSGTEVFVRDGKEGSTGMCNVAACNLKKLRTFNGVTGRLAIVTSNGYIKMYTPDDTKVKGFKLETFHVGGLGNTDGSTTRKTPIKWRLMNPLESKDHVALIKPTWNPLDLAGIQDVDVEIVGTATSSSVVFTVTRVCDGETVEGLVEADFMFLTGGGAAQSGGTFAENGDGEYQFTGSASFVTGTINLADPADQTTGGYESGAAASFTI